MRLRSLALVAVIAMIVASCGGGAPEAADPSEGIQVHGDWTIDIYNEDGTLDERVEFSNDLTQEGRRVLAEALNVSADMGDPRTLVLGAISTVDSLDPAPCSDPYPPFDNAFEPTDPAFVSGACQVVGQSEVGSAPDYPFVVSGSVVAEQSGTIDFVEFVDLVVYDDGAFNGAVTRNILQPPLPVSVEAGQQIQVQIAVTFTSR